MIHDADLKYWRRAFALMALLNLGTGVMNALEKHWWIVMACAVWAICCLMLRGYTATQQRTRDDARVTQAGIRSLLERQEP